MTQALYVTHSNVTITVGTVIPGDRHTGKAELDPWGGPMGRALGLG